MDKQTPKLTKNQKKRLKKKEIKKSTAKSDEIASLNLISNDSTTEEEEDDVEIEYVSVSVDNVNDPLLEEFKSIFQKFATPEELTSQGISNVPDKDEVKDASIVVTKENNETAIDEQKKISKKKKKLMSRLSVAELKQLVPRPDVVEAHDVTAADPRLLVFLKAYRNTVPIPRHWCHKRKYLQGKRGIEKPPFQLPEFIAETGIAKIRESVIEQEALKKSKQKARDRLTPKMGKIDIDYQVSWTTGTCHPSVHQAVCPSILSSKGYLSCVRLFMTRTLH